METSLASLRPYEIESLKKRKAYQAFQKPALLPGFNFPHLLRPGRLIIRVFLPEGLTPSGLVLAKERDQLPCMGHVVGCFPDNPNDIKLKDFVVYEPYHDYELDYTMEDGLYVPYIITTEAAIMAVVNPPPVRLNIHV